MELSKFNFLGYKISKVEFNLLDHFDPTEPEYKFNIDSSQNFFDNEPRLVEVVLDITVTSSDEALTFNVIVKGGFQAEDSMPEEMFKELARVNAPAILFPFARAIITTYTAQANIPPIILPAVNFAQKLGSETNK